MPGSVASEDIEDEVERIPDEFVQIANIDLQRSSSSILKASKLMVSKGLSASEALAYIL